MTGRAKFFLTLLALLILFLCFQIYLYHHRSSTVRNRDILYNQFNKLRNTDPANAERALKLIYDQDPHDQKILRQLGYWYLEQGNTNEALKYFKAAVTNNRADNESVTELAKLYMLINQPDKAFPLIQLLKVNKNLSLQITARQLLEQLPANISVKAKRPKAADKSFSLADMLNTKDYCPTQAAPATPITSAPTQATINVSVASNSNTPVQTQSKHDQLLNAFYNNKDKNRPLAWQAIKQLIALYPDDLVALKEAGFLALSEQRSEVAYGYLLRAYQLTSDPMLALQIAYILNGQGRNREAYHYFDLATKNPDLDQRYKAEIALSNLRGAQTKFLPDPFFIDVYANPLNYSRFNLTVVPIISRLGMTLSQKYLWQIYFSYRRTTDNRSGISVGLPQIYQDSMAVYALGTQIRPFQNLPMVAFFEAGKARNLVAGIQPHWRGDLRGGLAYYNEWGREAEFTFKPTFPMKYVADVYSDAIYYSRYQNWIGTARYRPGLEVFSYLASSIDIYFRGFLSEDTQRQFYNNVVEYGLGMVFIPSNRYNVAFRYEFTQGHYLPAGSPSANPYGPNYHNNLIECDFFFRF